MTMQQHSWRQSALSAAFDDLVERIVALQDTWTCEREVSGFTYAFGDTRHHVCTAIAWLESRATRGYDQADEAARLVAHEAFLAAMALGELIRRAEDNCWADPIAIDGARIAIDALLDELAPYVSRADAGLREVMLEDVPLETVLGRLAIA